MGAPDVPRLRSAVSPRHSSCTVRRDIAYSWKNENPVRKFAASGGFGFGTGDAKFGGAICMTICLRCREVREDAQVYPLVVFFYTPAHGCCRHKGISAYLSMTKNHRQDCFPARAARQSQAAKRAAHGWPSGPALLTTETR